MQGNSLPRDDLLNFNVLNAYVTLSWQFASKEEEYCSDKHSAWLCVQLTHFEIFGLGVNIVRDTGQK